MTFWQLIGGVIWFVAALIIALAAGGLFWFLNR